jgi:5'-phosphate synthase pdxT subunit
MATVGVLALQGGFEAHARALRELGHAVVYVRTADELEGVDGLVLPGGESTVHLRLLHRFGLEPALQRFHRSGKPILGTCAGLILAARAVVPEQASLGFLDVVVRRNAYGRQLDSFEGRDDSGALELVFIRAPRIASVGPEVETLATRGGEPVLVRQGHVFGAAFHPELTGDRSVHAAVFGGSPAGSMAS